VEVEGIVVSLKCPYYKTEINMPARSKHCQTHYQPFDVKNFIDANIKSKNSIQRWKCPICKQRAYDI